MARKYWLWDRNCFHIACTLDGKHVERASNVFSFSQFDSQASTKFPAEKLSPTFRECGILENTGTCPMQTKWIHSPIRIRSEYTLLCGHSAGYAAHM